MGLPADLNIEQLPAFG